VGEAHPAGNVNPGLAAAWVREVRASLPAVQSALDAVAHDRAQELLAAHRRVRAAARLRSVEHAVEAKTPPDLLGIYVFMPAPRSAVMGAV
jgi:hypothetical protein